MTTWSPYITEGWLLKHALDTHFMGAGYVVFATYSLFLAGRTFSRHFTNCRMRQEDDSSL